MGCIGDDTLFVGGTIGWDTGLSTGQLFIGATCPGFWDYAPCSVNSACDDGQTGIVTYELIDEATGTAIGQGNTIAGRMIEA